MKKIEIAALLMIMATLVIPTGCHNKKEKESEKPFDRGVMLLNFAGNIIKPSYENLQLNLGLMNDAVNSLLQNVNATSLTTAQEKWANAFVSFQHASAFNFGPAAEQGVNKSFMEEMATFPVSVSKIENYITASDTSFANFDRDSRGFLAVEYLLYGTSDNNAVIAALADSKRKNYLKALVHNMQKRTGDIVAAWNGAYFSSFVANSGTDAGSSVTQLFNEFLKNYELLKNYKLGLPAGFRVGQSQPEPDKVEAYYSRLSVLMMKEHFATIDRIWNGDALAGTDGSGFYEYLQSTIGGAQLAQSTILQMNSVHQALNSIDNSKSLSGLIVSNSPLVGSLHLELQKLTRYIKSDMSSMLGISITYASGDGD